ncbi:hypothetical protein UlMin_044715 [Ulmus minor]
MVTRAKVGIHKPKTYPIEYQLYMVTRPDTPIEPASIHEAINSKSWRTTMEEKLSALKWNNTWSLVPYSNSMNVVGNKWVFEVKYNIDGSFQRCKSSLVAKGFHQTLGIDFSETFSPVIKAATVRVILTMVVSKNWVLR